MSDNKAAARGGSGTTASSRLGVTITLALLWCGLLAEPVFACSVCFGDPNSLESKGMQAGIIALLVTIGAVLCAFAAFFLYLRRRLRMVEMQAVATVQQEAHGGSY